MNNRSRKVVSRVLVYFLAFVFVAISIFPIIWLFFTSLKDRVEIFSIPPVWFPKFKAENYIREFSGNNSRFPFLVNSIKVGLISTLFTLIIGTLAAYGIARFPVPAKKNIEFWILSVRMMPPVAVIVPLYLIMRSFKFLDKSAGLIIVHIAFNLPFVIWILAGFLRSIPKDIEEAALIDGCSWLQSLLRVSLPLAAPGLATTSIFSFMFSWNELLAALVLTGRNAKTLPVAISEYWSNTQIRWEAMAATSMVHVIPIIIVTFVIQRYIVRGLTLGAVKE